MRRFSAAGRRHHLLLMPSFRYMHLDVFAASLGGGNHLGVVTDARGWTDVQMQRFARWTNLVETTFLLPPEQPGASYRVRIFTPHKEIAFAGHPSIGSAHAVLAHGLAEPTDGLLWQECGAGVLPIRIENSDADRQLLLKSPPARVVRQGADAHPLLDAAVAGIGLGALPPALLEGGRHWWVVEAVDETSLRHWHPDHAAIGALAAATDSLGICVFARCKHPDYALVVRALPAGIGIEEDPASGAANGLVGAYIAHAEPDGPLARGYVVSQGREIGYDARLLVRIDEDGAIWVGGRTHTIIDGQLHWDAEA